MYTDQFANRAKTKFADVEDAEDDLKMQWRRDKAIVGGRFLLSVQPKTMETSLHDLHEDDEVAFEGYNDTGDLSREGCILPNGKGFLIATMEKRVQQLSHPRKGVKKVQQPVLYHRVFI